MSRRVTRSTRKRAAVVPMLLDDDSSGKDDDLPIDDDMAIAHAFRNMIQMIARSGGSPGQRKRSATKKKRAPKRRSRAAFNMTNLPGLLTCGPLTHLLNDTSPAQSTSTVGQGRKRNKSQATISINLDMLSDEEDVTLKDSQVNSLQSKVNNFFKVIESSDEDEIQPKKTTIVPIPVKEKEFYVIPSDSDEANSTPLSLLKGNDESVILVSDSPLCGSETITKSTETDSRTIAGSSKSSSDNKEDLVSVVDYIIDNYGNNSNVPPKHTPVKSLEELKKKTEEILGGVSSLIEDFNKKSSNVVVNKPVDTSENSSAPGCPICLEDLGEKYQPWVTFCGHMFCEKCIKQVCRSTKKCPTCRTSVNLKKIHPVYL